MRARQGCDNDHEPIVVVTGTVDDDDENVLASRGKDAASRRSA